MIIIPTLTNDQYVGLDKLLKWYNSYTHQFIEISGVIGTGTWILVKEFIEQIGFDSREIIYITLDQRKMLDMAFKGYHTYHPNSIIYKYTRIVNLDSLPVINYKSNKLEYTWKRSVRKKLDPKYKLMIVFDSSLLNESVINDLSTFDIPIILIKDPMLLPSIDTYSHFRDSNINLHELCPYLLRFPITYVANKVLNDDVLKYETFDTVSIIPKKSLNLYNLKYADMNITLSDELMNNMNIIYREKMYKDNVKINLLKERVIVDETLYDEKLVNKDNDKIKVYMTKGSVGHITKINKHSASTKYVGIEFTPDFYHEAFTDLYMDRYYLNNIDSVSNQLIPDQICKFKYAYALSASYARYSTWNRITIVTDSIDDNELYIRLLYTAITRALESITIVI